MRALAILLAAGLAGSASAAEPPSFGEDGLPPGASCSVSGPVCGGYDACEPYRVADAKCVCRCAGDDAWSAQVRCCLWEQRKLGRDPDLAHAACWGAATIDSGYFPAGKLSLCVSLCALKTDACTGGEPPCPGCCQDLPEDLPALFALVDCTADLKVKHCVVNRVRDAFGAPGLLQALAEGNPCLRAEAAHALSVFPEAEVGQALLEAAADRDPHVRMWAAWSLGERGERAALPILRRLARERRKFVAAMAREAIEKIEGRAARAISPPPAPARPEPGP